MTAYEVINMVLSSGVLAGGVGVLKWGVSMERRLVHVEVKTGVI